MAYCKDCNRELERGERRSDHVCDMAELSDGRIVHMDRVRNGDIGKEIDEGKVQVKQKWKADPVRSIGEKFGRGKRKERGPVLLDQLERTA